MRISASHPVAGIRGRFKGSPMVFYMRGGNCFARAHVRPRDPKSASQQVQRTSMGAVSRAWSQLTQAQRDGWQSYGERWFPGQRAHGLNTFVKVSAFLSGMPQDAPVQPPPSPILHATEEPSSALDEFSFRISHTVTQTTGWRVLVRTTPATVAPTRAPRPVDLRWVCGHGAASLCPLPQSGGVLHITGAHSPVATGQRYGVRLRLVSPEGVPGPEYALDLVRQAGPVPVQQQRSVNSSLPAREPLL